VHEAQQYIAEGYRWVADLDLEKFFDRVNHDRLLAAVAERVADKRMLKLIRAFLEAGGMEDGLVSPMDEGTPQGGPITPRTQTIISNLSARLGTANDTFWLLDRCHIWLYIYVVCLGPAKRSKQNVSIMLVIYYDGSSICPTLSRAWCATVPSLHARPIVIFNKLEV
jgi:hypothetical protein